MSAAPDAAAAPTGLRASGGDAVALFSVMWALAMVWHMVGNPTQAPPLVQVAIAVAAGLVVWRPRAPLAMAALGVTVAVGAWSEAPVVGNHWVLAGMLGLGTVGAAVAAWLSPRPGTYDRALLPTVRLGLLGFYAFAAFAKLNSSFLDRSVSCAVVYYQESTDSIGAGFLQFGGASWIEWAVIVGTVVIELSVPVALIWGRTRRWAVVGAIAFHAVLAIDQDHTFFDFSSLLTALFVTFLPAAAPAAVAAVGRLADRLRSDGERVPELAHALGAAVPVLAGLVVASGALAPDTVRLVGWWLWQPAVVATIVVLARLVRRDRTAGDGVGFVPRPLVLLLVPALVLFNGLTPYLEIKTGYGWNMYGNLVTVDGESNHLIVRRTLPLTDEQARPVTVLASDDPDVARYVDADLAITWRQFRRFLADHPDAAVTFERDGEVVSVERAGDHPELVDADPPWREKLQLFRVIDQRRPARCTLGFGPAR